MIKKEKYIFIMILLMAFSSIFGSDNYLPSFPYLSDYFNVSNGAIKFSMSIYFLAMGASQLLYGPLSDRIGRRPFLYIGYSIFCLGSVICALSHRIEYFLIGRFIQGLGIGGVAAMMRAIMRDTFSGELFAKVASLSSSIISITPPLAPIIGGYMQHYLNWQANFWFLAIAIIVLMLWVSSFFEESLRIDADHIRKRYLSQVAYLFRSKVFVSNLFCGALSLSIIIAYVTMGPYLLQETLSLTPIQFGWSSVVSCSAVALSAFVNSRLIGRLSLDRIMLIGATICIVGSLLLIITGLLGMVTVAIILFGVFVTFLGVGLLMSNASASALNPFPHVAGLVGSIYGASQMLITGLISSLGSLIQVHNQEVIGFVLLGCSAIIWVVKFTTRGHST